MNERGLISCAELVREWEEERDALLQNGYQNLEVDHVIEQYQTWAVTNFGVECLEHSYAVGAGRLWEAPGGHDWILHMSEKSWVRMHDFIRAFRSGQVIHWDSKPRTMHANRRLQETRQVTGALRFRVLRRDGYRCQICGAMAADGVKLHVDHMIPFSKGGPTSYENLWTLCEPCNQSKYNALV